MIQASFANRQNLDLLEDYYARWQADPTSVEPYWQAFFEGFDLGMARPAASTTAGTSQISVGRLIYAYRDLGHLLAHLDPLSEPLKSHPLLELSYFGLRDEDLDRVFDAGGCCGLEKATLLDLVAALRQTYCRSVGVEYMHIQDTNIRRWIQERIEPNRLQPNFPRRKKVRILMDLQLAELFEKFLHTRFVGQKRFSLEGAETLIPILEAIVEKSSSVGIKEIVIGMAHRGRLNVLANVIGKPYQELFREFEDNYLPQSVDGDGDVKYHLGFGTHRVTSQGHKIHVSLTPNPSHLEAVDPVVEGRTRAKQTLSGDRDRKRGMPLLIHGDAAFAGQGLVAETLNLSQLTGYKTGGTIHVIVNNQIGFTTSPQDARSTRYCTDVAKMIEVPIFHVNAEDPEAAAFVAELAVEFRDTYHKDVVIDMYCYRRHGHNEGDEPTFTQPLEYAKIKSRPTLTEVFNRKLIQAGDLTLEESEAIDQGFQTKLEESLNQVKSGSPQPVGMRGFAGHWKGLSRYYSTTPVETGVAYEQLKEITERITTLPTGFTANPKIARLLEARAKDMAEQKPVDWAFAETLAFGSLLLDGTPVRLSGQDSRRGTFSQRHAVLHDVTTGKPYCPLQNLAPEQGGFKAYDSLLSEAAVLGFEFGYSLDAPQTLVMWEAQFGDFANGAQVIIDQFIACSASKWQRDSGLTMLLPHGNEGQGPEHSSARLERFLQLCAEDNIQVCYPSTPAQYFHMLRRQMKRDFRKPLVVMTPKSMLRHKAAVSPVSALTSGTFEEVLDDPRGDPGHVNRLILCSGKVYYDLVEERDKANNGEIAIIRVEQLFPYPLQQIERTLHRYRKARELFWVQEESLNMGAWSFMEQRLRALNHPPKYVGRDSSASPATGSRQVHLREQKELVEAALYGMGDHLVRSVSPEALMRMRSEAIDGQAVPKDVLSAVLPAHAKL